MAVVQTVQLTLDARNGSWTDTGLNIHSGESLRVRVEGQVRFAYGPNDCAFPEGVYSEDRCDPDRVYSPESVVDYNTPPLAGAASEFVVTNTKPLSVAMIFRPQGDIPPSGADAVDYGLKPNRDTTYNPDPLRTGRVWLIFNDRNYGDNRGSFSVVLDRISFEDQAPNLPPLDGPVGGRVVPHALWSHKQEAAQTTTWCWVVKPLYGTVEAYVSLDCSLELPAYVSTNGLNPIDAMTYLPNRGVDLSVMPTTLKATEIGATDVTVLNFDRDKLRAGYYYGAEVEVFEVNYEGNLSERWVALSGTLGNADIGDLSATIELTPYSDMANKPIGDVYTYHCRHPFGEGGCRNQMLNDGPLLADWTRPGEVVAVTSRSLMRVAVTGTNGGSAFFERLAEGRLAFTSGTNAPMKRDVKRGVLVTGSDVDVELHQSFPYTPEVGDEIELSAGCLKDPAACKAYGNFASYGGFPFLPRKEGVMRRG